MYPADVSSPLYYRAHPYRNQLDLPNSAFKNREMQSFGSQIPQGKQYFERTNKKHFSNMFNRSEIQAENVLKEQYPQEIEELSRIAMDKSYFRSLNVQDIEGAKPNTLISKAIKNRQKAYSIIKKEDQTPKGVSGLVERGLQSIKNHQSNNFPDSNQIKAVSKQQQAVNKFNRNKSILENNSVRVLANYEMQAKNQSSQQSGLNGNEGLDSKINYHFRNKYQIRHTQPVQNQFQTQLLQKELAEKQRRIKDLERQLHEPHQPGFHNQKLDLVSNPYQLKYPHKHHQNNYYQHEHNNSNFQENTLNRPYEQNLHTQQIRSNYGVFEPSLKLNSGQSRNLDKNSVQINTIILPSTHLHESANLSNRNYQNKAFGVSNQAQSNISLPLRPDIDRKNIRKYNPTFLSFESDRMKGSLSPIIKNNII